jgi:hypothetical protein
MADVRKPAARGADRLPNQFQLPSETVSRRSETPTSTRALDRAILAGAVSALRKLSDTIRRRAASGGGVLGRPLTIIKTSESAHAFRIARDFGLNAEDLPAFSNSPAPPPARAETAQTPANLCGQTTATRRKT